MGSEVADAAPIIHYGMRAIAPRARQAAKRKNRGCLAKLHYWPLFMADEVTRPAPRKSSDRSNFTFSVCGLPA